MSDADIPSTAPPAPAATSADPVVSILVISYNTKAMTLDCLRSLAEQTTIPHEVIVVDNNSPDGSAAAIAEAFPDVRLIASSENYGFAKGNNVAARHARGEYVLLLNPDTVVLDHAIDRIVAFAERTPEARIWGGRTLYGDRTLNSGSCNNLLTLWSIFCRTSGLALAFRNSALFNPEDYGGWDRSTEREVGYVCGCFFLIKRALWSQLGGFDLTFVMYGEETDMCYRARALGARPRITPEATIIHYVGASTKRRSDKDALVLKSKVTLARRYLPRWQQGPAVFLLKMWPLGRKFGAQVVARVTGSAAAAETARRWGAVWDTRQTWQDGFEARSHPAPAPERLA